MAEHIVPHFHNDAGVPVIEIGAKEFMCIGATPPFDHPHVFCDMGDDNEFICSYCSTLYRYNPKLHADQSIPPECAWMPPAACAHSREHGAWLVPAPLLLPVRGSAA